MKYRFFYGFGQTITFKDYTPDSTYPVPYEYIQTIEDFLLQIGAKMGYYQMEDTDLTTLVLLKDCTRKDDGEYEEWCPHCGGCTLYDYGTSTVECMWCGEDLFPCALCNEYLAENEGCSWNDTTKSCKYHKHINRVPDFK